MKNPGLIFALCCALVGCQSDFGFIESYQPASAESETIVKDELTLVRGLKPGMSVDAAERLLDGHGFSCVRSEDRHGTFLDYCVSKSDPEIGSVSLLGRLYYDSGTITRRRLTAERHFLGNSIEIWSIDPGDEGHSPLPQGVEK